MKTHMAAALAALFLSNAQAGVGDSCLISMCLAGSNVVTQKTKHSSPICSNYDVAVYMARVSSSRAVTAGAEPLGLPVLTRMAIARGFPEEAVDCAEFPHGKTAVVLDVRPEVLMVVFDGATQGVWVDRVDLHFKTPDKVVPATPAVPAAKPKFKRGESYASVRLKLIKAGWLPYHSPNADVCNEDRRCAGRPEMEACSGVEQAPCKFLWRRGGERLSVCTIGEDAEFSAICD